MNKAKKLLSIMEKEPEFEPRDVIYYRVEGLMGGEWSFIFRSSDLIIADTAADEYDDKYDKVRVMQETPGGVKPIKGREYEQS